MFFRIFVGRRVAAASLSAFSRALGLSASMSLMTSGAALAQAGPGTVSDPTGLKRVDVNAPVRARPVTQSTPTPGATRPAAPVPPAAAVPPAAEATPLNGDAIADTASLLGLPARQVPASVEIIDS